MNSNEKRLSDKIKSLQIRLIGSDFERPLNVYERVIAQRAYASDDPARFIRKITSSRSMLMEYFSSHLMAAGCSLAKKLEIDLDD